MMKKMKMKNKLSNDLIFEAIKKTLVEDFKKANRVFSMSTNNSRGVMLSLNTSKGFGKYLYENPHKIKVLAKHINSNVDFNVKLIFAKTGEEEFYPLIEEL